MITIEQEIQRRLGIGGSDMPVILGLSKYKTPYQLYLEKAGLLEDTREETQLQYWGKQLEVVIRKEFRKRHKIQIETPKETIVHPFYSFLRGNVDGFIPKWNSVFEAKCSHAFMASLWGEPGTDIIPMEYLVQVAFYCSVMNAQSADLAVLIGGNDYREYKYIRDLELEKTIIDAACAFWDSVKNNNPPPLINMVDLKLMFPKHKPDSMKSINIDINKYLCKLKDVKYKIKELKDIENEAKFKIMSYMQDSECLVDENNVPLVSWKENKNGFRTFLIKGDKND